ncbi:hypothetical protein [Streptacidiphilus sp. EB103A]|uniref:hypothetical protein n=1 Tax=Streptacidiphilus sp. EB103A TaxID=3156275 RepID=UPI0035197366
MTKRKTKRPERRYFIEGDRRETMDSRKLGKVLLAVVLAEQQRASEAAESSESSPG